MADVKKDTKITIGPLRLSYPKLFEPEKNDQGVLKYGAAFLIPKSDAKTIATINKAVEAAKTDGKSSKWGCRKGHRCTTGICRSLLL